VVRVHAQLGLIPALRTSSGRWRILPDALVHYAQMACGFAIFPRQGRFLSVRRAGRDRKIRHTSNVFSTLNSRDQGL
jgi:hypothetical protein